MEYVNLLLGLWGKLTPEQKKAVALLTAKFYKIVKERIVEEKLYTKEEMADLDALLEIEPSQIGGFAPPNFPPVEPELPPVSTRYGELLYKDPFIHFIEFGFVLGSGDGVWWIPQYSAWIVQPVGTGLTVQGAESKGEL